MNILDAIGICGGDCLFDANENLICDDQEICADDSACNFGELEECIYPGPIPVAENCWDDYQLDSDLCIYVNLGTEPLEPVAENCWDDYQFDADLCIYVNLGTEPLEPVAENCWDDYQFDADLCIYVNLGTEPLEPVQRIVGMIISLMQTYVSMLI